ncbi:Alpha-2 adrenergic receptor [Varanus komodoensis]|uniref:alpha-2Da adrenergic receptor-like n=1 Tax=Varanus komodoensis TaxID=61221 RepID=UPI001CF7E396|nr:alpha-2Da adrenergic receptor-like [Varanus komodoensis]KAF7249510.1 Alpha-2 adrenergic receptor [Varanus komodoensis]
MNGMEPQHNGSSNQSEQVPTSLPYSPLATALILLAVLAVALVTLLGNILVVLAVYTSRALRAPQNLFLVSLAAADILVATLIIPFSLANEIMGYWCFGGLWCSLYLSLDVLFCTASIMHLCAISLDRYWAVTRAARYNLKRSPRRIKWMIGAVWAIAAFVSLPPLFKSTHQDQVCLLHDDTWYVLASCTASFYAPCVIMVAVYCRIYHVAKRRTSIVIAARRVSYPSLITAVKWDTHSTQQPPSEMQDVVLEHGQLPQPQPSLPRLPRQWRVEEVGNSGARLQRAPRLSWSIPANRQKRRSRDLSLSTNRLVQARERRFTFVLAFIIGAFVLCWFPFFFTYSLESVLGDGCCISKPLFKFFFWIGYCNSSFNPIIYTVFNRDFRRAFQRLLSRAYPLPCRK